MVPEIWRATDRIFLSQVYQKPDHRLYCSWDMACDRCSYFHFGLYVSHLLLPPGVIIIWHKCTKNHDHMLYSSWDMARDRCNFFSFWPIFCPFCPPNSPKNQNLIKKKKTPGDIIILHKCTKNRDHMLYCSWDMVRDRCNLYFSFWAIFCPFTSLTAWKMKFSKKWKKLLKIYIIILNNCTKNHDHMLYCSWDKLRDGCNCYFLFWATFGPFTP